MKTRVLLVSTVHPANDPRIAYKVAPALTQAYDVVCALPDVADFPAHPGVTTINLPSYKNLLSRIFLSHPVLVWKCLRFRPVIVHIFVPELIPVAFLFQWLGAKVVYEVQENLFKKFSIKRNNKARIYQWLFRVFDRFARKKFYCVFTEDAYLNEYNHLSLPSVVVHNYVSLPFIDTFYGKDEKVMSKPPVFFYCGVISMERSFDTLVGALVLFKSHFRDFHVHLFGKVQFSEEEMNSLPHFESVREHLTFHGYKNLPEAIPFAKGATAGIALLKPVADYADSYTTKLFEYMAMKLPVVTSDFPLYKKVVLPAACGFSISPTDPDLLAKVMVWLVENPAKAKMMGQNGRNCLQHQYNWSTEEQNLLYFYKKITQN